MMDHNETFGLHFNYANVTSGKANKTDEWTVPKFEANVRNILLATVLGILDILTIFGNLLVLLSFVFEKRLLQPFNIYILNLAVTDFLVAITAMTLCTVDTLLGYWPFGIYLCGFWIYFDFGMTFASVFTMAAISVDRFWCVTWPVHFRTHNNNRKSGVIITVIWVCVIAVWTPPFTADRLGTSEQHTCIYQPSDNREFAVFVRMGHYLPCVIMILCYIKVLLVMRPKTGIKTEITIHKRSPVDRKSELQTTSDFSPDSHAEGTSTPSVTGCLSVNKDVVSSKSSPVFTVECNCHTYGASKSRNKLRHRLRCSSSQAQRDRRIFITLTYVLAFYIICWFPFYITFDVSAWQPDLVPAWLYSFFFWSTYVNSTLNPFIYAYTNKEFRAAFKKVHGKICICSTTNGTNTI